jgi:hypothetical protein
MRSLAAISMAAALSSAALAKDPVADAPPLPPDVAALNRDLRPQGGGEMTFFGLSIYDGWFWSDSRAWTPDRIYALDLHYHRDLKGTSIAERSVAEIEKIGRATAEELKRWGEAMRRVFPDVRNGDRITGVNLPPNRVQFFLNGTSIGEIADPRFGPAFFGIWLDPNTSNPDYREKLLGRAP